MENVEFYRKQLEETKRLLKEANDTLAQINKHQEETIAIIGMAMRFPGHVNNAKDYWNVLVNGIDCISDIPEERWLKTFYSADKEAIGKINTKQFGFIDDVDEFDDSFFDISPLELENIDEISQ